MSAVDIRRWLITQVARETRRPEEKIDIQKPFARMGLDSVSTLSITGDLSVWLQRDLPDNLLQQHPTIEAVAEHLTQEESEFAQGDISRISRTGGLAVSLVQERVLRYAQFAPPGDRNVVAERFVIKGSLDLEALSDALGDIVQRHEVLRTTFGVVDGAFVQRIHAPMPVAVELVSCEDMEDAENAAYDMARHMAVQPMLLECGPLFRAVVFKTAPEDYRVLFLFHHVVADAGALEIFHEELGPLYEARRGAQPAALPELPVQMADLAAWERQWLDRTGASYQSRLEWWCEYLEDLPSGSLALPAVWTESPDIVPDLDTCQHLVPISDVLLGEIRELARVEAATPRMVWIAALAVLIDQKTGMKDFVIGTYASQRRSTAARRLIGMFATMVPVRVRIMQACSFRELLARLAKEMGQMSLHQEVPFEDVLEALHAQNRTAPQMQVLFNHYKDPSSSFVLPGLETGPWHYYRRVKMPWGISVAIIEDNHETRLRLAWDGSIYNRAEMRSLAGEYLTLVQTLLKNPGESGPSVRNAAHPLC